MDIRADRNEGDDIAVAAVVDTKQYIDWAAVLAGTAITAATSLVLHTFGSSMGLAIVSPWSSQGVSPTTVGIAAALYFALAQIYAYGMGAYFTGRMRPIAGDSVRSEVTFRDGVNGLTVWAVGIVGTALILAVTAMLIASSGAQGLASGAAGAGSSNVAGQSMVSTASPREYAIDMLLRPTTRPAATGAAEGAGGVATGAAVGTFDAAPQAPESVRAEINRIFANGALQGEIPPADRSHLARIVETRAGLDAQAARERVDTVLAQTEARARSAAETARTAAASAGFWTAFVLILSAIAAVWAGTLGGEHRDRKTLT